MYETLKFQVSVQVTVENLTELKEVAATCGVPLQGAYVEILTQTWAADESSGKVWLVDMQNGSLDRNRFYWTAEEPDLVGDHEVVDSWVWYFEDLAGDQVKITGGGL